MQYYTAHMMLALRVKNCTWILRGYKGNLGTLLGDADAPSSESVEVWRWKHKLFRIKIDLKNLWESFHASTHTYFFGRKDAAP